MLVATLITVAGSFLLGYIASRGDESLGEDREGVFEDKIREPREISDSEETVVEGQDGGIVKRARSRRVSKVLTELMEEGSQQDFVPDEHVLALIDEFDGAPVSLKGSLLYAVPSITRTSRNNVNGWKGVRWQDDMRDIVDEVTKGIVLKPRKPANRVKRGMIGRRKGNERHMDDSAMRRDNGTRGLSTLFEYSEAG